MAENSVARSKIDDLAERLARIEAEVGDMREKMGETRGEIRALVIMVGTVSALASLVVQIIAVILRH